MSNTLLLIQSDTTDGSTTFADQAGRTVTAYGDVQHSTTHPRFGATSILFDGTGDYLTVPSSADFDLGTGDFTIDFWAYMASISDYDGVIGRADGFSDAGRLVLRQHPALTGGAGFELLLGGGAVAMPGAPTGDLVHVAVVRKDGVVRGFYGGTRVVEAANTGNIGATDEPLYVGVAPYNSAEAYSGWLDEIRITDGAEWWDDFEPPDAQHIIGNILRASDLLGPAEVVATNGPVGWLETDTLLGPARLQAFADWAAYLDPLTTQTYYALDLVAGETVLRLPISSWQATAQLDRASYLHAVVPAAGPWLETIQALEEPELVIYKGARYEDGSRQESELMRAPLQTLNYNEGPTNATLSLSGYSRRESPGAPLTRTLQDVRSVAVQGGSYRVRARIDWFLLPGHQATARGNTFSVAYINYYSTGSEDYMDVGERAL